MIQNTTIFTILLCLPFLLSGQIYVDKDAQGAKDGSSWENAYTKLQQAIDAAETGSQIWVAKGHYHPTKNVNGQTVESSQARERTFFINKNIEIYGGFSGDEHSLDARNWEENTTIINGYVNAGGDQNVNVYHVILFYNVANSCILDGVTITGGKANKGEKDQDKGGGIYNLALGSGKNSSPVIRNCKFRENTALFGGGFYSTSRGGAMASPILTECNFFRNVALEAGGGVFISTEESFSAPVLTNCIFRENSAESSGGALCNFSRKGEVAAIYNNCEFYNNEAVQGAAVHNYAEEIGKALPVFNDCNFEFNNAELGYGAGMFNSSNGGTCSPELANCLFENNSASYNGGAIYNQSVSGSCSPKIYTTTIQKNNAFRGAGMYNICSGGKVNPEIIGSVFFQNTAGKEGGAIYTNANLEIASPIIINCTFARNAANESGTSMYNKQGMFGECKPVIKNSILWDYNGSIDNIDGAAPEISFSIVQKNELPQGSIDGGGNLLNQNPLFVSEVEGNLNLKPCSPAIDYALFHDRITQTDIKGNTRRVGELDLGAYENQNQRDLLNQASDRVVATSEITTPDGWTHYINCGQNTVLLSLKKNGQNIGTIGDGSFKVEIKTTEFYGSGEGLDLSNASYVETNKMLVMNRYWNVVPTNQPSAPVNVRFYYSPTDLADLMGTGSIAGIEDLYLFKIDNTEDPFSTNVQKEDFHEYNYDQALASTETWTTGTHQGFNFAEYQVTSFSGGGISTGHKVSALPVELISFEGTKLEDEILLTWSTASEANSFGFEIRHSRDAQEWEILDFVHSHGNTDERKDYRYLHGSPLPGVHYYKLRSIDYDDTYEESKVAVVEFDNKDFQARVFPNPMPVLSTIKYNHTGAPLVSIRINDMNGKELFHITDLPEFGDQIELNHPIPTGIYMVSFESENHKEVKRLVVQGL